MESNIIPDYKLPFTDRKTSKFNFFIIRFINSMHAFKKNCFIWIINKDDESRNKVEVFDFDIQGLSEKFDEKRFNLFCKTNG